VATEAVKTRCNRLWRPDAATGRSDDCTVYLVLGYIVLLLTALVVRAEQSVRDVALEVYLLYPGPQTNMMIMFVCGLGCIITSLLI